MNPDLSETLANARRALLAERNEAGHWEGELSTSALSTATAAVALHTVDPEKHADLIAGAIRWLIDRQNDDGGWGDTILSKSNISTTLLCWATLNLRSNTGKQELAPPGSSPPNTASGGASSRLPAEAKAENWIEASVGSLETGAIVEAVKSRYGKDRTFSVPILMLCAICGRLGGERERWKRVLPLPFELSAFPRKWFAALQMPVVSYALPALIAIGHARFFHVSPPFPLSWIRKLAWRKASRLLAEIQPSSGGFLEAAPLTSFVTMALASSGQREHPVVGKAVEFLIDSVRPDGSWPIDTNLATWGTTLAAKALISTQEGSVADPTLPDRDRDSIRDWLLGQQYREVHPFTAAPPGGWAWTDLPGGVPDGDDTPGALLALRLLADDDSFSRCREAAEAGIVWLLDLQNRDGGIPTFCRGWGALPFDRSSPDLTAHTLRAWRVWRDDVHPTIRARIRTATEKALNYLARTQRDDGSWHPLWFGNQDRPDEANPTYGTAKVLLALEPRMDPDGPGWSSEMRERGARWLLENQNDDGGWGGGKGTPSSIEETALAIESLVFAEAGGDSLERGVGWLIESTGKGTDFPPAPIGFYFAKLWYFEKLYPIVWTVSALERVRSSAIDSNRSC